MVRKVCAVALLALGGLDGCADGADGSGCAILPAYRPPELRRIAPFRDAWRTEVDAAFGPDVRTLAIGHLRYNDNFANRGDVILRFDGPPNRIRVELRRFTFAPDNQAERADEDYASLLLWAYSDGIDAPARPLLMDPEAACSSAGWRDGCAVYVWYDGAAQLARSGADIRVTLPPTYRHDIRVATQDNAAQPGYPNRGNVCALNLPGSVDITMGSGTAYVSLAPDITPAPGCSDVGACVAAGWDPSCPCARQRGGFGSVRVTAPTHDDAPNITVDVPSGLWTRVDAYGACDTTIDVPGFDHEQGIANYPGEPANPSRGYFVEARAPACKLLPTLESPSRHRSPHQFTWPHGIATVTSGELLDTTCDALLPGL